MISSNTPLINEEFLDILEHATNLAIYHDMTFICHSDQNIFRLKSGQRSRNRYTISRTIYFHWDSLNFLFLLHTLIFPSQFIMVLLLAHTQSILPSRTRWKKKFQNTLPNASIIGACAVSLSTSYAFGDTFKARHSLHYKLSEAKFFYGSYAAIVILAGAIVLIPNAPLGLLTLAVQALAGI